MAKISASAKVSSDGDTVETQKKVQDSVDRKLQDSVFFNPRVLNETI